MANKIVYATTPRSTDPIKQIKVSNARGYLDLTVNKNKNGKAVRISNRLGTSHVFIGLKEAADLASAINQIVARGVKLSVDEVSFDAA